MADGTRRPAGRGLPSPLEDARARIEHLARDSGLDFHDVLFELCDYDEMSMIAAYGGFPTRYPHWRWGMEYLRMQRAHEYGLQRIYELVINNDPVWAYLLDQNAFVDQQLVMAHVYAHADFFKNNAWFARTNRKMLDTMANHAARVRRHIDREGTHAVERWIDLCLSLDNLVDPYGATMSPGPAPAGTTPEPPWDLRDADSRRAPPASRSPSGPLLPTRDVLGFLLARAPLAPWQADVLAMIRDEALYFLPQAQTKIMNEGWASFWHTRLMTGAILDDRGIVDYADHHAATVVTRADQLNPYKIGLEVFRAIEARHGLARTFEARRTHNDVTFLDTFLDEETCARAGLFTWSTDRKSGAAVVDSRGFAEVRARLLFAVSNRGDPCVRVTDDDHGGLGELHLVHTHEGVDVKLDWATEVLANLAHIWGRPVHLRTRVEDHDTLLRHDGTHLVVQGPHPTDAAATP
ncbi:MAG: hypothetical protein RLZZ299_1808 [Pseudomonadota bacterium]|jgi:stage V sporulation protein R